MSFYHTGTYIRKLRAQWLSPWIETEPIMILSGALVAVGTRFGCAEADLYTRAVLGPAEEVPKLLHIPPQRGGILTKFGVLPSINAFNGG